MLHWLIGKSEDIDIIWNAYPNDLTETLENARNISLFETISYKYIYKTKDFIFFKNNKGRFESEVVIKGLTCHENDLISSNDKVYFVDKFSKLELFDFFLKIKNEHLDSKILNTVDNLSTLQTILILKNLEIEQKNWHFFIKNSSENWYKKMKNNELIQEAILDPSLSIPILQYFIKSNIDKKAISLYLNGKIKQGYKIWEFKELWENLI